jgi:hypothetical protein
MRHFRRLALPVMLFTFPLAMPATLIATSAPARAQTAPGVGVVPQGLQSDGTNGAHYQQQIVAAVAVP